MLPPEVMSFMPAMAKLIIAKPPAIIHIISNMIVIALEMVIITGNGGPILGACAEQKKDIVMKKNIVKKYLLKLCL